MAKRKMPAATAAGILPVALAMLPGMIGPSAPGIPPASPAAAHATTSKEPVPGFAFLYPNPDMTPGVANPDITQDNVGDNICNASWSTKSIRPPASYTTPLKKSQMTKYDDTVSDPGGECVVGSNNTACYEEDHLISLENGGDPRDPGNLWPEPYKTTVDGQIMGARQKDLVESFIHDEICFGIKTARRNSHFPAKSSIPLARGQEILATDWYACYLQMTAGGECK
jgi:hypothetical protein